MIAILSDTHNHNWSVFSHLNEAGVNNRLQHILDETWRAAETAKELGCTALVHGGDMFHVRGSVAPSVLNPTLDLYARITTELGLSVYILAGNHDLENNNSERIGNASEALVGVGATVVSNTLIDKHSKRLMIPYHNSCDSLRAEIARACKEGGIEDELASWSLFIHAPLNGVIAGIPDNGFSASELKEFGFGAVFCGHYHNHQVFDGNVCSIGALTHQTFGDIGAKAGFVIYDETDGEITHHPSIAPQFIEFQPEWGDEELIEYVKGNYVRARLEGATNSEVEEVRSYLKEHGASGIQIVHIPKVVSSREEETVLSVSAGASVKTSIAEWCDMKGYDLAVQTEAQAIMDEVESKVS